MHARLHLRRSKHKEPYMFTASSIYYLRPHRVQDSYHSSSYLASSNRSELTGFPWCKVINSEISNSESIRSDLYIKMTSDTYDIVIVGGGTAGLVLAARLSEDAKLQVVVIECGEDRKDDAQILTPGLWPLLPNSPSDWAFRTVPQVYITTDLNFCVIAMD